MQLFTDQLLSRASVGKLESLRGEILASYIESKSTDWSKSKSGGKYKLSSSRIGNLDKFPITSEVASTLISGKVMRRYFFALRNSYTASHNIDDLPYKNYSLQLGKKLLAKYVPEFLDERYIWGIKISPLKLRTLQQYHILRDAANALESKTGVTPAIPSLHLSILKHQTFIPIHVDDKSKILSVMLYLATPEQNNNVNLGTSFWYPRQPEDQIIDTSSRKGYESEKLQRTIKSKFLEHRSPFVDGSIVSFLKTSSSWHSFSYDGPNLGPRVSLNLNIHSFR